MDRDEPARGAGPGCRSRPATLRVHSFIVLLCATCVSAVNSGDKVYSGKVVSGERPLEGVTVRLKATKHHTQTSADGSFSLRGAGERVTAWKAGYFIVGAPIGNELLTLRLRPLPTEDHAEYAWVDPRPSAERSQNCGNCHGEIYKEWAGSAHGRSGTNRRFLNLYAGADWLGKSDAGWSLLKEHPLGAAVCSACHAPTVPFDHPGFDDFRKLDGVPARGVHCDYCHKIVDVSSAKLGLEHGRFAHKLLRPKEGQLFFGPLDDVDRGEDAYAPLYQESRYCASCHEGTIFGTRVYTTYSEWLASPARQAGKQCQSCHMTPTGKLDNIAPGNGGVRRDPQTLASHHMPGGDEAMLKRGLRVQAKLKRSEDRLTVEVETLATDVGHRVPTGFIDRHLLLVVEAETAAGKTVQAVDGPRLPVTAGRGEPAQGSFAGLAGKLFARQIEDEGGTKPVPFWRPNREFADTRLVPDQPDRGTWTFPAEPVKKVRVRLIYRRFWKLVADEKGWPENEIVVADRTLEVGRVSNPQ